MPPADAQASSMRARFEAIADHIARPRSDGVVVTGWFAGEVSDFVRFNHARVRQAGTVSKATLYLRAIDGERQAGEHLTLSGEPARDRAAIDAAVSRLVVMLADIDPDPHLLIDRTASTSTRVAAARLASAAEGVEAIVGAAGDADLVGFFASGPITRGYASSLGHHHWHESASWSLDFSIYAQGDKAVKDTVAGTDWDAAAVVASIEGARAKVPVLRRPVHRVRPGRHRVLLAPAALGALVEMLGWGGFSARAHLTGQSPLHRARQQQAAFAPSLTVVEELVQGGVPGFQEDGFVRPARIPLIEGGRFGGWLASPRTAREFGIDGNAADGGEAPQAMVIDAGTLPDADGLRALGTGLWISNFWYMNWSDRRSCRVTGMTRFATVWVEDGEPVAPVDPMRFDDSLYQVLGEELEALGERQHVLPNTSSYDGRMPGGVRAPAGLVRALTFTL